MSKDNSSSKSSKTRYNLRERKSAEKEKKKHESSDSSDNSDSESESEVDMNQDEYQKFLSKIFPSKHMTKKIEDLEKFDKDMKKSSKKSPRKSSSSKEPDTPKSKSSKNTSSKSKKDKSEKQNKKIKNTKKSVKDEKSKKDKGKKTSKSSKKKKKVESSSSDDSDYDDDDYIDEDELDDEEIAALEEMSKQSKFNIIFTIGDPGLAIEGEGMGDYFDEYEEDSDYEESEEEDSDEDSEEKEDSDEDSDEDSEYNEDDGSGEGEAETVDSDSSTDKEKTKTEKTKGENIKIEISEGSEEDDEKSKKLNQTTEDIKSKRSKRNVKKEKMSEQEALEKFKQLASEISKKDKKSKIAKDGLKMVKKQEKQIKRDKEKRERKDKNKNMRKFREAVKEKNVMNDFNYFKDLDLKKQKQILAQLEEVNKISDITKPYRMQLLEADIDPKFKAVALKKVNMLRYMEPGNGEFYKIKNWVDTFMRIPFGIYNTLNVKADDGIEASHEFMSNAKDILDKAVYGLNDAKLQIMQMAGQWITNPQAVGNAIAIKGPMGTGKTTLVKEGISKILNRPFEFIALGGATDSSFLEGHSYTYEGSTWGHIVDILIKSKCMNPVIYFDELDKVSDTPKGEEIIGILTHLTDTSQNTEFHDKYFADLNFDLSKVLFIFSYNDENRVNPILRDRMYRIHTKGYDKKQKTEIVNNYLIPAIREAVRFKEKDIEIPEETLHYIIENHTMKEDGVRNLKRCIEIIYTKLNLFRLMKPDTNLFDQDMSLKVEFPFTVTKEIVDKLIKKEKEDDKPMLSLYL